MNNTKNMMTLIGLTIIFCGVVKAVEYNPVEFSNYLKKTSDDRVYAFHELAQRCDSFPSSLADVALTTVIADIFHRDVLPNPYLLDNDNRDALMIALAKMHQTDSLACARLVELFYGMIQISKQTHADTIKFVNAQEQKVKEQ